jgi:hypothetical protein
VLLLLLLLAGQHAVRKSLEVHCALLLCKGRTITATKQARTLI